MNTVEFVDSGRFTVGPLLHEEPAEFSIPVDNPDVVLKRMFIHQRDIAAMAGITPEMSRQEGLAFRN